MALKAQKALEAQVNETLYNNINILTYQSPPHKDFWEVFKKDMFSKNNKAAFIHVVYYLLYTLNPETIKEKVRSWPVLDPQDERQFRVEVTKYLNELNEIYENANMPSIMTSQLVSPGGFRFAKYMLKLSMLVLQQSLYNDVDLRVKMLAKPSITKNCNAERQIKNISKLAAHVDVETKKSRLNFHNKYAKFRDEADVIVEKLNKGQHNISLLQEKLKTLESMDNQQKYEDKVKALEAEFSKIKDNSDKLSRIKNTLDYLTKDDLILQNNSTQELDLIVLFEKFNLEMEEYSLEMKTITDLQLDFYLEKFTNCNTELNRIKSHMSDIQREWLNASTETKNMALGSKNCVKVLEKPNLFPIALSSSDILAVPLDSSESL